MIANMLIIEKQRKRDFFKYYLRRGKVYTFHVKYEHHSSIIYIMIIYFITMLRYKMHSLI